MNKQDDGWPKDREVLYNPQRKAYHKEKDNIKECVFCHVRRGKPSFENLVLYKGKKFMVVLNKYPYHIGHMMVMPKRHVGDLHKLKEDEYIMIQLAIRVALRVLEKEYKCHGLNVGINLGRAAGAGIPHHLHYHLIPRWIGDCNFFPQIAKTRVMSEGLEETYHRIRKPLEKALRKLEDEH